MPAIETLCTECHSLHVVVKPVDQLQFALLLAAGVRVIWTGSHSSSVRDKPAAHPPLTADDLLDFHLLLASDDWFGHVISSVNECR